MPYNGVLQWLSEAAGRRQAAARARWAVTAANDTQYPEQTRGVG